MDLALQNIKVELGHKKIVQDISLDVQKGEFVGLIGPNGRASPLCLRLSIAFSSRLSAAFSWMASISGISSRPNPLKRWAWSANLIPSTSILLFLIWL